MLFFFAKKIFIVSEQKKKLQTNAIYNIHNYIQNTKIIQMLYFHNTVVPVYAYYAKLLEYKV